MQKTALYMLSLLALAGCSSRFDMQGYDPNEYYAAHPIENRLEARRLTASVHFSDKQARLASPAIAALRAQLHEVAPAAAESVHIRIPRPLLIEETRGAHVAKLLRSFGYNLPVTIEKSDALSPGDVLVDMAYVAVVPPDCPDWKKSPVTTYSNTPAANYGCAAAVNLGQMVANPRDLVKGQGTHLSNTELGAKAISDYRSGAAPAAASSDTTTSQ